MKTRLLILALLTCFGITRAEILTLDSCLEMAKHNNCTIRAARLDVAMAEQVKKQVLWKFFPQVNVNAFALHGLNPIITMELQNQQTGFLSNLFHDLSEYLDREYDGRKIEDSEIKAIQYAFSAQVMAVQPVFWGGQIVTGNRLASLGIDASKLKSEVSERDLLQQVEETYWLVAGLIEKRETIQRTRILLDSLNHVAGRAFNNGLVTRNDLLRVQLKQNEIEATSIQLEDGIQLASKALFQLIGRDYDYEPELETFPEVEAVETVVLLDTISIDNRPEVALLDLNIKAQKLQRRLTLGEVLPHIGLGAQLGYSNINNMAKYPGNMNVVGFAFLSIPLTAWGENGHKIREHNLRIKQAELLKEDLTGKMRLQNEQAYNRLSESIALMQSQKTAIELAQDNFNTMLLSYKSGVATMTELMEAEALLLLAHNNYTDARINYRASLRRFNDLNK